MPGKLKLVVGLMIFGVAVSLLTGAWVSAVIGGALTFGVLVGNDGVRAFLRGAAAVQILLAVGLQILPLLALGAEATGGNVALALLAIALFGVGVPAYMIWALGEDDVRNWMFRKNFKLDDEPSL